MSENAAIQISDEEIKEIDRNLQFALGVLELFHGVGHCDVCYGDPVLLEAERRLHDVRQTLRLM